MLFGLIARSGTFAINAGLVFVLSQQAPQLDWWHAHPISTALESYRNTVLDGLDRVRIDLETNGKLLFRDRQTGGAMAPSRQSRVEDLDRRAPRPVTVTD